MKFEVDEIAVIVAEAPEFKVVSEEMLCADDGTYEQTLTKSEYGYEWVVQENVDPDPWPDGNNFREFDNMESLLKFLKGEGGDGTIVE